MEPTNTQGGEEKLFIPTSQKLAVGGSVWPPVTAGQTGWPGPTSRWGTGGQTACYRRLDRLSPVTPPNLLRVLAHSLRGARHETRFGLRFNSLRSHSQAISHIGLLLSTYELKSQSICCIPLDRTAYLYSRIKITQRIHLESCRSSILPYSSSLCFLRASNIASDTEHIHIELVT